MSTSAWQIEREGESCKFALKSLHFQLLMNSMLYKKYEREHNNAKLV